MSLIFKSYYGDKSLKVEKDEWTWSGVGDNSDEIGEHYQSNISKLSVKLNNNQNDLKLIVKEPIQTFVSKIFRRLMKPFMRYVE